MKDIYKAEIKDSKGLNPQQLFQGMYKKEILPIHNLLYNPTAPNASRLETFHNHVDLPGNGIRQDPSFNGICQCKTNTDLKGELSFIY